MLGIADWRNIHVVDLLWIWQIKIEMNLLKVCFSSCVFVLS